MGTRTELLAFKARASQTINQILAEPHASLLNGILLGIETGIPEGLPIVATIALARGTWRMARRNVLVNRLSAVETRITSYNVCYTKLLRCRYTLALPSAK